MHIKCSDNIPDVFWMSYVHTIYVLCPGGYLWLKDFNNTFEGDQLLPSFYCMPWDFPKKWAPSKVSLKFLTAGVDKPHRGIKFAEHLFLQPPLDDCFWISCTSKVFIRNFVCVSEVEAFSKCHYWFTLTSTFTPINIISGVKIIFLHNYFLKVGKQKQE